MLQNLITKPAMAQPLLSLNMPGVDELFPGFLPGDFALLYGSPSVISLTSLLCVRAQLPFQLGGLGGNVVFIDGGNTTRLYNIARLAQLHQLNTTETLKHIVSYLSNFARKHQIVLIATYLPYENSKRNRSLQEMTFAKATTVLSFAKTKYMRKESLEKHPSFA